MKYGFSNNHQQIFLAWFWIILIPCGRNESEWVIFWIMISCCRPVQVLRLPETTRQYSMCWVCARTWVTVIINIIHVFTDIRFIPFNWNSRFSKLDSYEQYTANPLSVLYETTNGWWNNWLKTTCQISSINIYIPRNDTVNNCKKYFSNKLPFPN